MEPEIIRVGYPTVSRLYSLPVLKQIAAVSKDNKDRRIRTAEDDSAFKAPFFLGHLGFFLLVSIRAL